MWWRLFNLQKISSSQSLNALERIKWNKKPNDMAYWLKGMREREREHWTHIPFTTEQVSKKKRIPPKLHRWIKMCISLMIVIQQRRRSSPFLSCCLPYRGRINKLYENAQQIHAFHGTTAGWLAEWMDGAWKLNASDDAVQLKWLLYVQSLNDVLSSSGTATKQFAAQRIINVQLTIRWNIWLHKVEWKMREWKGKQKNIPHKTKRAAWG